MTLDQMKAIAAASSKGKWDLSFAYIGNGYFMLLLSHEIDSQWIPADKNFIAMAANHIDALIAVAEAAKITLKESNEYFDDEGAHFQRDGLGKALAALESDK